MATYYVDGAVGSDSNPGTSAGAGNAWLTIGKALSVATAGLSLVWIKSSAVYTISTGLTASAAAFGSLIRLSGYSTTPGDGGKVTIRATAAITGLTVSGYGYNFENIIFDGNSTGTLGIASSGAYGAHLINCDVTSWTGSAVQVTGGGIFSWHGGEVVSCGGTNGAIDLAADPAILEGLSIHGNTGVGVYITVRANLIDCKIWANGSHGVNWNNYPITMVGCTVNGNSGDGLRLSSYHIINTITNSIFTSNGGYGINSTNLTGTGLVDLSIDYNFFGSGAQANTSGARSSNIAASSHDLSGNPQYVNAATGDFTPQNAAVQAGFP